MTSQTKEQLAKNSLEAIDKIREELKAVKRDSKAVANTIVESTANLLALRERTITDNQMQMKVWQIWGHCRMNRDSLESERHCKLIYSIVAEAVSDVQKRLEESVAEVASLKSQLREAKSKMKSCGIKPSENGSKQENNSQPC